MRQDKTKMSSAQQLLLAATLACATGVAASFAKAQTNPFQQNVYDSPAHQAGMYVGGNVGLFRSRGGEFDDDDNFFEVLAGYKFNPFVAVEGAYLNFGDYGGEIASASLDGWSLAGVGLLPVTETLNIYAKAGVIWASVDVEGLGFEDTFSDNEFFVGLGASLAVTEPLDVIVEYNRYRVGVDDSDWPVEVDSSRTDIDTLKLGVKFRF